MHWKDIFKFEIVNNRYKIIYLGSDPITVTISTNLLGVEWVNRTITFCFQGKGVWFIPNLDYRGCSKLILRDATSKELLSEKLIETELSDSSKTQNIICLGLNKTGTSSFVKALDNFGYSVFPEQALLHNVVPDVFHKDYGKLISILNNPQYNVFNDAPFSFPGIHEIIFDNRPNDIYVLTLRANTKKWVKSVVNFYDSLKGNALIFDNSYIHTYMSDGTQSKLIGHLYPIFKSWGIDSLDNLENKLTKVYDTHIENCVNFFSKKKNFFIVEIEKPGELKKFTNWLGLENTTEDFPWENRSQ